MLIFASSFRGEALNPFNNPSASGHLSRLSSGCTQVHLDLCDPSSRVS